MAAAMLLRGFPLLRFRLQLHHHRLAARCILPPRWPLCTAANESTRPEESASSSTDNSSLVQSLKDSPKYPRWNDADYRQWKDKEEEILRDIEPILMLTKDILHSRLYVDGERLTAEDEKAVVERLLAYHPRAEDKIGCGLDSIMDANPMRQITIRFACTHGSKKFRGISPEEYGMCTPTSTMLYLVDRHPQFRQSRCLFIIRTDGAWIDFSYQKCLRQYIRVKYPSHAERFIREHFKRGSGL
ncbi:hypothetical protein TorRG33x02_099930 [Trema orientale]|uniref:Protein DCL n=1 Tax=Trema orientale TaxID=63057 RepID=A0A2P5F8Y9_TREOI|nr:hypothetical protein TorRG33x02_099930 [Trema orientale]